MNKKSNISLKEAKLILRSFIDGETNIKIFWDDVSEVHYLKKQESSDLLVEMLVDRLSLNFLEKVRDIPLVKDVEFFPRIGTGTYGINLLFKVIVTFQEI